LDSISKLPLVTFDFADLEYEFKYPEEDIKKWLLEISFRERAEVALLEYIFCTDEYLLEINKEYLEHDYYTDIITFPLQVSPLEGTVFISIERVKENAVLYSSTMSDELHRVMAHGLLHLLGHNDKTDEEKKNMRDQENQCLAQRTFC